MRAWACAMLAVLCGCAHYTTTSSAAPTKLGSRLDVPAGFASGETSATWILGLGPFGSDNPEKAVARARGKNIEASLGEITIERRVTCVPACEVPVVKHVRVIASGSLMKPTGYRDADKAPKAEPVITQRFPEPSAATLADRLKSFYLRDPAEAESYYESLRNDTREELAQQVMTKMGLAPVYGQEFKAPASTSDADCRFLKWFLHEHTTYRLSAETCDESHANQTPAQP